jgi:predicted nucleic acid-binding protein
MIVVADSSPLILLIKIGHVGLFPSLFQTVTVPTEVASELAAPNRPENVREFIAQKPCWLLIKAPARVENIPSLDAGEEAAISLAVELKATLLLIDEQRAAKQLRPAESR